MNLERDHGFGKDIRKGGICRKRREWWEEKKKAKKI